jgi:hypothetical protein
MKTRSAGWCVGVLLLISTLTTAEAAGGLTQVAPWMSLGSPARDVVIKDHFAYVTTDIGLKVVDLTTPATPVVRGSLNLGGRGLGVKILGDLVYVASQTKDLQIVNVSNPDAPALVVTKSLPGSAWDVALKDDRAKPGGRLIAYVASFAGEVYVVDVTNPVSPQQIKVLGILAWGSAGGDATSLAKLNNHVTSGNGKVTGLAVSRDDLVIVEWAYGRKYHYDVTDASNPIFAGTHYAPFTFRVAIGPAPEIGPVAEIDPPAQVAYSLSAFGGTSGIYSVPLGILGPSSSTRHATCAECDYFQSPPTDNGGLTVSANGKYVIYIAGKLGEVQVVDVTDPTNMKDVASLPIPHHYAGTAYTMGVAQYGDYIIAVGAKLGLGAFHLLGLSE